MARKKKEQAAPAQDNQAEVAPTPQLITYQFNPDLLTLNVQQLAACIHIMGFQINGDLYTRLSPAARRHWQAVYADPQQKG